MPVQIRPVPLSLYAKLSRLAKRLGASLRRLGASEPPPCVFAPTVASAPLRRAPRAELGPNQIAWLEKRSPVFRRARRAAVRARQQADRHEARTKGAANGR